MGDVFDDVHQESARLDQAQVEVETREVPHHGGLHDVAGLMQRFSHDGDVTDLRDEGAAFQIDRHAQLEVLTAPEVQLEDVAAAADVLVRVEGLFQRQRRYAARIDDRPFGLHDLGVLRQGNLHRYR